MAVGSQRTSHQGTQLAISALNEDSGSLSNGNEYDNSANDAGAVYVFHASNNTWVKRAYLKSPNADSYDLFGKDIDMSSSGDWLAVGAPHEQSSAFGINGDTQSNALSNAGAVYLFEQSEEVWSFTNYYKATNTDARDNFGQTVALEDSLLVAGAVHEASNAQGISGEQADNSATQAGAVYLF